MNIDAMRSQLPSRAGLEEDRKHLQALMIACIHRVYGAYPNPTEEHLKMRNALLSPFALQNDRIGDYLQKHRSPTHSLPEIDAHSGLFIEDPELLIQPNAPT